MVIIKKVLLLFLSLILILTTSTISVYAAPPSASGNSIIVEKVVQNDLTDTTTEFEVTLLKDGKKVSSKTVTQGAPATFGKLSTGNYTLTETPKAGYELVNINPISIIFTGKNDRDKIIVTNKKLSTNTTEPANIHYVALGDSLATGTTSRGTTKSYVHGFYDNLKNTYGTTANVTMTNLSNDGNKAADLLSKLTTNTNFRAEVAKANIITISIGGNNILGAGENSFSTINHETAEGGTKAFEDEYDSIIEEIRLLSPSAKIIAMTLYNPYNTKSISGYTGDLKLHEEINPYILRINAKIEGIGDSNYKVADVYSHFLINYANNGKMGDITYFYPSSFFKFTRDPHPNQTGQNVIVGIHNKAFLGF